jgi:hypothetical protein
VLKLQEGSARQDYGKGDGKVTVRRRLLHGNVTGAVGVTWRDIEYGIHELVSTLVATEIGVTKNPVTSLVTTELQVSKSKVSSLVSTEMPVARGEVATQVATEIPTFPYLGIF